MCACIFSYVFTLTKDNRRACVRFSNKYFDYADDDSCMQCGRHRQVWIPLTLVGEGNTLYAESVPGKGDYAPFEAEYGTAVLFWGNQCSHYSTKNSTEDCTRVSFDLRVVRADDFIEDYVHPDANPEYSRSAGLRRGMHYTDTAAEREWRRGRPTAAKES